MRKHSQPIPLEVRETVILRSRMICEDCRVNKAEHMHHNTYARVGCELPEDIEYLCIVCHGKRHPDHNFKTKWEQRQIEILKRKYGRRGRNNAR
jgi:hypothetical protein